MATESVAPAAVPTQVLIPARDLIALRDEIDLLRLAVYGVLHAPVPEEPPVEVLERAVNRVADLAHALVGEYAPAADAVAR